MHPNLFLKTFWRMDLKPQVFVAMSFQPAYTERFKRVIEPAINAIEHGGKQLTAYRVDNSKTGDSILTDIMDGIAHSQLILADVSTLGSDSKTGDRYRSGNVMYEVGLALACRQSAEVLVVRDDEDKFLFNVSTIPHKKIDFTDTAEAKAELVEELTARLKEQDYVNDARVQMALTSVTNEQLSALLGIAGCPCRTPGGRRSYFIWEAIPHLLEKQLVKRAERAESRNDEYDPTPLGQAVANLYKSSLPQSTMGTTDEPKADEGASPPDGSSPSV
jgi:hypothetical protein